MAEKSPAQRQREQRLARQLRENLKRRKAQARGRARPQRRNDPPTTDKSDG
jgi:hypothetical protein